MRTKRKHAPLRNRMHGAATLAFLAILPTTLLACTTGEAHESAWTYCQATGTVDHPSEDVLLQFASPELFDAYADVRGLPADLPAREAPPAFAWRCADGDVLVCLRGNNLPCDPADTSTTPSDRVVAFCSTDDPTTGGSLVPNSQVGSAHIYQWGCEDGEPVNLGARSSADERGFVAEFWEIVPLPE